MKVSNFTIEIIENKEKCGNPSKIQEEVEYSEAKVGVIALYKSFFSV